MRFIDHVELNSLQKYKDWEGGHINILLHFLLLYTSSVIVPLTVVIN